MKQVKKNFERFMYLQGWLCFDIFCFDRKKHHVLNKCITFIGNTILLIQVFKNREKISNNLNTNYNNVSIFKKSYAKSN